MWHAVHRCQAVRRLVQDASWLCGCALGGGCERRTTVHRHARCLLCTRCTVSASLPTICARPPLPLLLTGAVVHGCGGAAGDGQRLQPDAPPHGREQAGHFGGNALKRWSPCGSAVLPSCPFCRRVLQNSVTVVKEWMQGCCGGWGSVRHPCCEPYLSAAFKPAAVPADSCGQGTRRREGRGLAARVKFAFGGLVTRWEGHIIATHALGAAAAGLTRKCMRATSSSSGPGTPHRPRCIALLDS